MYLALKWLVVLTLGMWVFLCSIDAVFRRRGVTQNKLDVKMTSLPAYDKNITSKPKSQSNSLLTKMHKIKENNSNTSSLYYFNFFAGALVVMAFNKRANFAQILSVNFVALKINVETLRDKLLDDSIRLNLNRAASKITVALREYCKISCQIAVLLYYKITKFKGNTKEQENINKLLLNNIKELSDERKNLGQLLMAAIQENKNIRLQYKLESMAKTRLIRHLDEIQKQNKTSRSKYVTLKQVYMITTEENAYLKARANKLKTERDEVVKNLMILIKEVQKTPERNLKALCSQIMTQGTIGGEETGVTGLQSCESLVAANYLSPDSSGCPISPEPTGSPGSPTEQSSSQDFGVSPFFSDEPVPKLRGLPGEYMWTVKDKNGLIEKLYEYDYGYIYDNGDTIRRIRKYTVYHDKDCLLDFSSSKTVVQEVSLEQNCISQGEEPASVTSQMYNPQGQASSAPGCSHTMHPQEPMSPVPGPSQSYNAHHPSHMPPPPPGAVQMYNLHGHMPPPGVAHMFNPHSHMPPPGAAQMCNPHSHMPPPGMYNHQNHMPQGMPQIPMQMHEMGHSHNNTNHNECARRCTGPQVSAPPAASNRFLTGSVAFQAFLQNNKDIVVYAPRQRVLV